MRALQLEGVHRCRTGRSAGRGTPALSAARLPALVVTAVSPDNGIQRLRSPDRAAPAVPAAPAGAGVLRRCAHAIAWWVERMRRHAGFVVIAALVSAVSGGYYTAGHLGMNTDSRSLISPDLPFRKLDDALDKAFPQFDHSLVIVVEGTTADRAEDAARTLANALRPQTNMFDAVFYPEGDPFFRRNGLLFLSVDDLQKLANRIADAQPLLGKLADDMSLRGLFGVLGEATGEVAKGSHNPGPLVRVFTAIADTVDTLLKSRLARLSWRALMSAEPLKPADYRQIIVVQPRLDFSSLTPAAQAMTRIRALAASLNLDAAHGVRLRFTGSPAINEDELHSVRHGMATASAISLLLVTVIAFTAFRSFRLMFAAILTLVVSLVWTATFAAVAIGHLNLLSIGFAVLFIGLAVDFSIQFGLRYKEAADDGHEHAAALRDAATGTAVAVGLAGLCAAIGFLAFVPTDYIGLSELGVIAGVGMFIGLFGTLSVLPALLTLLPTAAAAKPVRWRLANGLGRFQERHAPALCLGALGLGLVALVAVPEMRFDIDPINLQDPTTESVKTFKELTRDSSTSPYSISILMPSLKAAEAIKPSLNKLPEVDSVVTLGSFVPERQGEKLDIIDQTSLFLTPILEFAQKATPPTPKQERMAVAKFRAKLDELIASPHAGKLAAPARHLATLLDRFVAGPGIDVAGYAALEKALLADLPGRLDGLRQAMKAQPVTLASLPQDLRRRYLTPDGRARVEVFPSQPLTESGALRRFVDAVRTVAPNATDMPVVLLESGDAVVGAFERGGTFAIAMISLLLVLVLRSVIDSLLVLLPLALALALTVAIMVLIGMPLNFANIIALPLLVSLGVAFGIYLVLRYRETTSVVDLLNTSTPRAVLFSALTTMVAFGSLMVSSHRGTASMGALLALCLTLALGCTLVVLPALLAWRARSLANKAPAE